MAIVGETYKFVEVNSFEEDEPLLGKETYCHDYFEANPVKPDITPTFCKDAKLEVASFDPLTNNPVDITKSIVSLKTDGGWKVVADVEGTGATQSIPLPQNGDYTVALEAGKIESGGTIKVECNVQKCSECKPKLSVPILDREASPASVLYLNWDNDVNLDLIVSEESYDDKFREWAVYNCVETPERCTDVTIEAQSAYGFEMGEAMSIVNKEVNILIIIFGVCVNRS